MLYLGLHIAPLDDGPKVDAIIQRLQAGGLTNHWSIQRPNDSTNALLVSVPLAGMSGESWERRIEAFRTIVMLFDDLNAETIVWVHTLDLTINLRIHTTEFFLPLPADVIQACGRLGLGIDIYYVSNVTDQNKAKHA